jgi:hypothetical protein
MSIRVIKQKAKNKRFKGLTNNELLHNCSNDSFILIKNFFLNTDYLLKQNKQTYYNIVSYYKSEGININKSYLYKLHTLKYYKTCNTLILSFIANYLNIPLIELLTKQFYLNDSIKPIVQNDISSF